MENQDKKGKVIELDVRPQLRKKEEPFAIIMESVKELQEKDDTLILHATFCPDPLLKVLKSKGFAGNAEQQDPEHWIVTFVHE